MSGASDSTIIVWLWEQGNSDHPYRIAARLTVDALSLLQNHMNLVPLQTRWQHCMPVCHTVSDTY